MKWLEIQDKLLRGFLCVLWVFGGIMAAADAYYMLTLLPEKSQGCLIFFLGSTAVAVVAYILHQILIQEANPEIK